MVRLRQVKFLPALLFLPPAMETTSLIWPFNRLADSYYADAIYTVPEGLVNETTHAISFGGSYTPTGGQAVTFETPNFFASAASTGDISARSLVPKQYLEFGGC